MLDEGTGCVECSSQLVYSSASQGCVIYFKFENNDASLRLKLDSAKRNSPPPQNGQQG